MTVRKLIEVLKTADPDAQVRIDGCRTVTKAKIVKPASWAYGRNKVPTQVSLYS